LQNFPVIAAANASGLQSTVSGTLNSSANSNFDLEFFSNPSCDSSGFGEGAEFLGAASVTTDASGNATFNATLPVGSQAGHVITATATSAQGDTSEFAACVVIAGEAEVLGDITGDGAVNVADLLAVISAWGACGKTCPADIAPAPAGDGAVGISDLLMVISHWS
jgi:hypothetical protein